MRLITSTTIALLVLASTAMAQTQFYGPSGQYQGMAVSPPFGGGSTQFYGSRGEYQGSVVTPPFGGGTSQVYGPRGEYQGTVVAPPFGGFGSPSRNFR